MTPARHHSQASVSIVMVSYHTGAPLRASIAAALNQPEAGEVILVDNGNPPAVRASLQASADASGGRLSLLTGHGNIGFAAGCNLGARAARGDHLLLLNPDCELPPGGLGLMLAASDGLPRPWMLSGRLENPDGSEQRGSRRALLTPRAALVESFRLDRVLPGARRLNLHETAPPATADAAPIPVPAISGACMFLPRADYCAIGGMDEGYFLHVEDLDFCFRFTKAGGTIYHLPSVSILHHRSTSAGSAARIEWHKARGFMRYFRQNFRADCPAPLRALINAGILARFALTVPRAALKKAVRARQTPPTQPAG